VVRQKCAYYVNCCQEGAANVKALKPRVADGTLRRQLLTAGSSERKESALFYEKLQTAEGGQGLAEMHRRASQGNCACKVARCQEGRPIGGPGERAKSLERGAGPSSQ